MTIAAFIFASLFMGVEIAHAAEVASNIRPAVKEYKAEDLKDPFQGKKIIVTKEEVPKEGVQLRPFPVLAVQGLVWGGNFPQAIINDRVVKIGDVIEEARITGISKQGVALSFDNRLMKLDAPAAINMQNAFKGKNE